MAKKVIVFGPTGAVGSATARAAAERGASVVLAMRDTSKPIPGLDADAEKHGRFERIEADLTKPDTVGAAVSKTGATQAFIYCAHGMPDFMKSTAEALRAAGTTRVVVLSTVTVQGDPRAVDPSEPIPYGHAQVEANLEDVFGADAVVAVRPGSFASNAFQHIAGFRSGELQLYGPDAMVDRIVPEDIGRVCGAVLTDAPKERIINLLGPQIISQRDEVRIITEVVGKSPKVVVPSTKEALDGMIAGGFPPPVAEYLVKIMGRPATGDSQVYGYTINKADQDNVEKYGGKRATTLREWAEQQKQVFAA